MDFAIGLRANKVFEIITKCASRICDSHGQQGLRTPLFWSAKLATKWSVLAAAAVNKSAFIGLRG